jgi:hypothetical protein
MHILHRGTAVLAQNDLRTPCAAASSSGRGTINAAAPPRPPRRARLYRPARNPNQSANPSPRWVLELEPQSKPWMEPLMGWTASADVDQQVRLTFPSKESALRYALRHGLSLDVEASPPRVPAPAFARQPALHSCRATGEADEGQTVA